MTMDKQKSWTNFQRHDSSAFDFWATTLQHLCPDFTQLPDGSYLWTSVCIHRQCRI